MEKFRYVLWVIGVAFTVLSLQAQTRRALVIGLGEQEDKNWTKINGDKDVPYVIEMLERSGYRDIVTLVNRQATKAGIVSAFSVMAGKCQKGDVVYVHFSGHGQLVTDINGDEEDTWDESWIPYDAYLKYGEQDKGEKHLIDDEINRLLSDISDKIGANGRLLVVVDACHSGDSSRGEDIGETVRGVKDEFVIPIIKRGNAVKLVEDWLILSACKDYQLNQEMKNPQVGKLTYALYVTTSNGDITMENIKTFMSNNRGSLPQTPVLSGKTDKYNLSDFISIEP